jgi:hypothetical protein
VGFLIVEGVMPMLTYLDETFGLFNQTLDPHLGDAILMQLNPWLRSAISGAESTTKSKAPPVGKIDDFDKNSR